MPKNLAQIVVIAFFVGFVVLTIYLLNNNRSLREKVDKKEKQKSISKKVLLQNVLNSYLEEAKKRKDTKTILRVRKMKRIMDGGSEGCHLAKMLGPAWNLSVNFCKCFKNVSKSKLGQTIAKSWQEMGSTDIQLPEGMNINEDFLDLSICLGGVMKSSLETLRDSSKYQFAVDFIIALILQPCVETFILGFLKEMLSNAPSRFQNIRSAIDALIANVDTQISMYKEVKNKPGYDDWAQLQVTDFLLGTGSPQGELQGGLGGPGKLKVKAPKELKFVEPSFTGMWTFRVSDKDATKVRKNDLICIENKQYKVQKIQYVKKTIRQIAIDGPLPRQLPPGTKAVVGACLTEKAVEMSGKTDQEMEEMQNNTGEI